MMSRKQFAFYFLFALMFIALPAAAALNPGDDAPNFTTEASLGGKHFAFAADGIGDFK